MIKVTRLNDSVIMVNVDRIQSLQSIPETVITFTNNDKIMVKEPLEEVSQRIVDYQRTITNTKLAAGARSRSPDLPWRVLVFRYNSLNQVGRAVSAPPSLAVLSPPILLHRQTVDKKQ